MPEDGIEDKLSHNEILSFEDMIKIVKVFADLGIKKIRITGGEPLVRKGIVEFIGKINEIDKIEEITLTTNGYYLEELAYDLKLNGLDRVNISLDTLDENKFKIITRGGNLDKVIRGIKAAQKANLTPTRTQAAETLLLLVAPMVPHLAEEAWEALGREGLIADAAWPEADPALLVEDEVTIAVQVNGKLRDTLTAPKGAPREALEEMALASEKVV
ncbi:MAG TPA: radical SAM protein, partial [Tissierellaceae bacterium]